MYIIREMAQHRVISQSLHIAKSNFIFGVGAKRLQDRKPIRPNRLNSFFTNIHDLILRNLKIVSFNPKDFS